MKTIDASHGGQVVRIAVGLSALTSIPIRVINIRKNRPNPGLRAQHIKAVEAVAKLCNAEVEGLEIGSKEVKFFPGELEKKKIKVDIKTAGSLSLLIQALILPASVKGLRLLARGGTDVPFSPPIDYMRIVTFGTLEKFGFNANLKVLSRGYYPRGGGEIDLLVKPSKIERIEITEEREEKFYGISHATNLKGVAERMKKAALKLLAGEVEAKVDVVNYEAPPWNKGCAIVIGGFGKGGSSLGKIGKKAEIVGIEAAKELLKSLKYPLDEHMSDQILPFVAVFGGRVKILETSHVRALLKLFKEMGISYCYSNGIFEASGL